MIHTELSAIIKDASKIWPEYVAEGKYLATTTLGCDVLVRGRRNPEDHSVIQRIHMECSSWDWNSLSKRRNPWNEQPITPDNMMIMIQQALEEAKRASSHANLVTIYDYHFQRLGETEFTILIRMEYVPYVPQPIGKMSTPSNAECIHIGMDLCSALAACQEHSLSPERDNLRLNQMLFRASDSSYCLMPFSLWRLLENMAGWPKWINFAYGAIYNLPPEWYAGGSLPRSVELCCQEDLYSLGLLMYLLCNEGQRPFMRSESSSQGRSVHEARRLRISGQPLPPPSDASDDLWKIIQKACAPESADRFSSPEHMKQALSEIQVPQRSENSAGMWERIRKMIGARKEYR